MPNDYFLKNSNLAVRILCVDVPFCDPNAKQFELSLAWLDHLRQVYQTTGEEEKE